MEPLSTASGRVTLPFDYTRPIERFIVKFNHFTGRTDEDRIETVKAAARENGTEAVFVEKGLGDIALFRLDPPLPPQKSLGMVASLESKSEIVYSEPDYYQQELAAPNDPLYAHQWSLQEYGKEQNPTRASYGINAEAAWDLGYKGAGENIAVVDSGITDHPDLDGKVLPGYDFIMDVKAAGDGDGVDNDPHDMGSGDVLKGKKASWHGTHVAGVAAASTNNGVGVAGVAPDASIVPVRAMGSGGGTTYDIVQSILWAAGEKADGVPVNPNPASVINLSLGTQNRCNPLYAETITKVTEKGIPVVVAAGNSNVQASTFSPASCDGVITVGATGPWGKRAYYSNYDRDGSDVIDIAAPGGAYDQLVVSSPVDDYEMILSTVNEGAYRPAAATYGQQQGTSQAAPAVAGVIAMMKDANPNLTTEDMRSILQSTSNEFTSVDVGQNIGAGIVDAREAVCEAIRRNPEITEGPCAEPAKVPTTPTVTTTVTSTAPTPTSVRTSYVTQTNTQTVEETTTETSTHVTSSTARVTPTVDVTSTRTLTPAPTTETVTATTTVTPNTVTETATMTTAGSVDLVYEYPTVTTTVTKPNPATDTVTSVSTVASTITPAPLTTMAEPVTVTSMKLVTSTPETSTVTPRNETTVLNPVTTTEQSTVTATTTETPAPVTSVTTVTKTDTTTATSTATETTDVTVDGEPLPADTTTTTVSETPTKIVTTTPTETKASRSTVTREVVPTVTTTVPTTVAAAMIPTTTVTTVPTTTVTETVLAEPKPGDDNSADGDTDCGVGSSGSSAGSSSGSSAGSSNGSSDCTSGSSTGGIVAAVLAPLLLAALGVFVANFIDLRQFGIPVPPVQDLF